MRKTAMILFAALMSLGAMAQQKAALYVTDSSNELLGRVLKPLVMERIQFHSSYTLVDRTDDFQRVITKEQAFQRSGMVADEQIKALGIQFGADVVVAIDITQLGGAAFVNARILDVETAEVKGSGSTMVYSIDQLPDATDKMVKKMLYLD